MCIYVFAFPTKTSISKKIASDLNPPALKGACVLALDLSSQSASFVNVVPISQELPGKAFLFDLLPLREAYSCLVAMGTTNRMQAVVQAQTAQSGRCLPPALGAWR